MVLLPLPRCLPFARSRTLYGGAARTMCLFYLDNLPDTIVLLCCCPVRCCAAELVPHFTLHALRSALYMLFPSL